MPLPESQTLILPPDSKLLRAALTYDSSYSETESEPFHDENTAENLTPAQNLWLTILLRIAELYPQSPVADKTELELIAMSRVWADEMSFIPDGRIWDCYTEAMRAAKSDFVPSAGTFKAAWERIQANTRRETFREQDERLNGPEVKALNEGPRAIPLCDLIFKNMGRAVVCKCKYSDGIAMAAQIEESGRGPRWKCGRNYCNFDVDANDEAAVKRVSVEPHIAKTGSEPKVENSPLIETKKQNRAELFAEICNLDYEQMTPEQREEIRKMAYWNDFKRAGTNEQNFAEHWEIYLEWADSEESKRLARDRAQRYA